MPNGVVLLPLFTSGTCTSTCMKSILSKGCHSSFFLMWSLNTGFIVIDHDLKGGGDFSLNLTSAWSESEDPDTVEPVLKDCLIGHKNKVSQDRWSLVTGSFTLKCKTCQSVVVLQDRWSVVAVISQGKFSSTPLDAKIHHVIQCIIDTRSRFMFTWICQSFGPDSVLK